MKIEELSTYTEIDRESANDINGGFHQDVSLVNAEGGLNMMLEVNANILELSRFSYLAKGNRNKVDGLDLLIV